MSNKLIGAFATRDMNDTEKNIVKLPNLTYILIAIQ